MSGGSKGIACHLGALTPLEREHRADLASRVQSSILSVQELANGYVLNLNREIAGRCVEDLVSLERRCCPFLRFRLGSVPTGLELEITGPEGSKELLSQVFGL